LSTARGAPRQLRASCAARRARVGDRCTNAPDGAFEATWRRPLDCAPQQPDCADLRKKETGRAGRPVDAWNL
jgi:hypothetical protein